MWGEGRDVGEGRDGEDGEGRGRVEGCRGRER